jgi:hypothetical protein
MDIYNRSSANQLNARIESVDNPMLSRNSYLLPTMSSGSGKGFVANKNISQIDLKFDPYAQVKTASHHGRKKIDGSKD